MKPLPSHTKRPKNLVTLITITVTLLSLIRSIESGYGEFSLVPTGWPLSDVVDDIGGKDDPNSTSAESTGFTYRIRSLADRLKLRLKSDATKNNNTVSDDINEINTGKFRKKLSPVILLPGYGGSRLEAKWDKTQVEHYFCDSHSDWTDIWVNVKLLLPYMIDCLIENMRLEFDHATNTTHNTNGVDVRVKDADTITSVEYLNNLRISSFAYFAPIIRKLIMGLGYKREINIRGAPYDFRKAPNELKDYFVQLRETSDQIYKRNNNQPITYICHSMGCNNILYFLQRQTQEWKDEHVKRVISIAAPWAGSLSALRAAALGDNLGMPYLFDETKLIRVQRSLPSTIYLFPHQKAFPDAPLIRSNVGPSPSKLDDSKTSSNNSSIRTTKTTLRTYMADDYKEFFDAIKHPDGYQMWLNTKDLLGNLEAPGVEVWCLVGRGQKTLGRMEYEGEFPNSQSDEFYDDGDGTVTLQSAKYCAEWAKEQSQPIYIKEFGISHMEILKDAQVTKYIERILDEETPMEGKFKMSHDYV